MVDKAIDNFELRTKALPSEMRILLEQYPREDWEAHPGFKEKTQQWLRAHQSFRLISEALRNDAEAFIDQSMAAEFYAARLSHWGNRLIGNLHGHHAWEDHEYFPELSAADPRFDPGLEILEKDHEALDSVLDTFANGGNRILQLEKLDQAGMKDEVGKLHGTIETIEAFLDRHLGDEEELAVPIILHHRLRG